jgi:SAM-dependent methyltransferase
MRAKYDTIFFNYVNSGAIQSAERLLPFLLQKLEIDSVLDVGCGQGAWLSVWRKLGVQDVIGIDGNYVDRHHLLIPETLFFHRDLAEEFNLGRRFHLVQSLEVAEHLPEKRSSVFVESLVNHGDLILFSAAPKGQGGYNHINEQDYNYWRTIFAGFGYAAIDYLRPLIINQRVIEPWYRYNPILYASSSYIEALPEIIQRSRVPDKEKIRDLSPPIYKIRKEVVGLLPVRIMTWSAKLKSCVVTKYRDRKQ